MHKEFAEIDGKQEVHINAKQDVADHADEGADQVAAELRLDEEVDESRVLRPATCQGVNFTNILRAALMHKSVLLLSFSLITIWLCNFF